MEQVDKYVNSVYRHVGGNKEEIIILKEEMRDHLLQIIEELKSEGKSEDESISIAIKSFGEESQIENELLGVFKFVDKGARKALIISVAFLLITITSFFIFVIGTELSERQYFERNTEIFNIISSYGQENIDTIDKNISTVLNKSKEKYMYVSMFRVPNGEDLWDRNLKDLEYIYPRDTPIQAMDKGNLIGKQITTEKGIKYSVNIGLSNDPIIPMYIKNIGRSTFVWLSCFIVSIITWILLKKQKI
jgi:hypothetical protein